MVKMGVTAARKCLKDTCVDMPDAIITGTSLGCIADTEKFLGSIIHHDEKLLNPTPFIQSTHNTVASAIALAIGCHAYNITYVHRGFSFENALLDGMLQLHENPDRNILVGAVDEITEHAYDITRRMGFWKRKPIGNLSLLEHSSRGTLPGEGVTFFMLGDSSGKGRCSRIMALDMLYNPADFMSVEERISILLKEAGLAVDDLDLALLGISGDETNDRVYEYLLKGMLKQTDCAYYKHLCGEYDTSAAFALWLADRIIVTGQIPATMQLSPGSRQKINHILIYNHLHNNNHSMILLSA
jgi:3-oxoacyl-(acyl-carrier-protein) synthase